VRKLHWSTSRAVRSLTAVCKRNASWIFSIAVAYLLACHLDFLCQSRVGWAISRISSYHAGSKSICDIHPFDPLAEVFHSIDLFEGVLDEQPLPPISEHLSWPVRDVVTKMNAIVSKVERRDGEAGSDFANGAELEQLTGNVLQHADALFKLESDLRNGTATDLGVVYSLEVFALQAKHIQQSKLKQDPAVSLLVRILAPRIMPSRLRKGWFRTPQDLLAQEYRDFAAREHPDIAALIELYDRVAEKMIELYGSLTSLLAVSENEERHRREVCGKWASVVH